MALTWRPQDWTEGLGEMWAHMVDMQPLQPGEIQGASIRITNNCQVLRARLPRWLSGKESACHTGDVGLIHGLGRSPGEENSNPLQYSCLGNPMDREAWQSRVHGVTKGGHYLATKQQQE